MKLPANLIAPALATAALFITPAPAPAEEAGNAFSRGETIHLEGVEVRLGEDKSRYSSTRQGNIDLDDNTFLFGREDTYESMLSQRGIASPSTGATIGLGMKFSFDSGL